MFLSIQRYEMTNGASMNGYLRIYTLNIYIYFKIIRHNDEQEL